MSTPRRDFLGWLGAAGALATLPSPLGASAPPASPAARPHDAPVDGKWDLSWADRVTGKYKAVFDSPEPSEGAGLWRAQLWRDQYKAVYGTEPAAMSSVLVIRHNAIPLAANDAYWERFEIGKELKMKDGATKKWAKINPLRAPAKDASPDQAKYSVEGFLASGGIVLACNLAWADVVMRVQKAEKLEWKAAEERAKAYLIPGVILQPSGVFAALRAQEAGCSYFLAS